MSTDTLALTELPPRIASKIAIDESGCWLWTASLRASGYGAAYWRGKSTSAHRVTYELIVGPVPDGLDLDHLCRVRHCCNPEHLEPVTHAENVRRAPTWKLRLTHCRKGLHAMWGDNVGVKCTGSRYCRACAREYSAAYSPAWNLRNVEKCREYKRAYKARKKGKSNA